MAMISETRTGSHEACWYLKLQEPCDYFVDLVKQKIFAAFKTSYFRRHLVWLAAVTISVFNQAFSAFIVES